MMYQVNYTDHKMAAYLRKVGGNDWTAKPVVDSNTTEFYSGAGDIIALGVYDNSRCTRKFYVNEDTPCAK